MSTLMQKSLLQVGLMLGATPALEPTAHAQDSGLSHPIGGGGIDKSAEQRNRMHSVSKASSHSMECWKDIEFLLIDAIKESRKVGEDRYAYQGLRPSSVRLVGALDKGANYKGEVISESSLIGNMIVASVADKTKKEIIEVVINSQTLNRVNAALESLGSNSNFLALEDGNKTCEELIAKEKDSELIKAFQEQILDNEKELNLMRVVAIRAAISNRGEECFTDLPSESDMRELYHLEEPSNKLSETSRPVNEAILKRKDGMGSVDFKVTKVGEAATKEFVFENVAPNSKWTPGEIEIRSPKFKDKIKATVEVIEPDKTFRVKVNLDPSLDTQNFRAEFLIPSHDSKGPGFPFKVFGWRK